MLPITSGIKTTKINILVYSLLLAPIVALPFFFNFGSLVYLTFSSLMSTHTTSTPVSAKQVPVTKPT